jgi:hypothetical protein
MTCNNQYLLIDQYPNLHLFDKELTLVKQFPWKYNPISDMCWSSTLNSFIIITFKEGGFLVNEDMTLVEPIKTIEQNFWSSCTCSDESLFVLTNKPSPTLFQFNLLSSFHLIRQWNSKESLTVSEFITSVVYNHGTLALLIINEPYYTKNKIELRTSTTLDLLWSLSLDLTNNYIDWMSHVCSLRYDEWLIIDHKSLRLLHISKDGKLKTTKKYDPTPRHAVLFGSNILAIRTTNCVNFHNV